MCECGCSSGLPAYRLPINETSYYAVELYSGCKDCTTPPGITVRRVEKGSSMAHIFDDAPVVSLEGERDEMVIKCGLDPDEFEKLVEKLIGFEVSENGVINKFFAEGIAEELWEPRYPEVIDRK